MKCTFCNNELKEGRGVMLVKTDGSSNYYCNSKCEKNVALKRDPRYVKWTATYAKNRELLRATSKK